MMSPRTRLAACLFATLLVASCSDSSDDLIFVPVANLNVVHASPGAPNIDVAVDGEIVARNIPYGASTDYLDVEVDDEEVAILPTGSATPLLAIEIDFDVDENHSLVIYGLSTDLQTVLLEEQNEVTLEGDELAIKVMHASQDAGPIDVYVTAPEQDIASTNPLLTNLQVGQFAGYVKLLAGNARIRLTPTGTLDVVFDSGTLTFAEGSVFSIYALDSTDDAGSQPFQLLIVNDRDPSNQIEIIDARTTLRLFHAIADGPDFDLVIQDEEVNSAVPFQTAASYSTVLGGDLPVIVRDTNGAAEVFNDSLLLDRNKTFTLFALGTLAGEQSVIALEDAPREPIAAQSNVRILHASTLAGAVDVYLTEPGTDITTVDPDFEDLTFAAHTGYFGVVGGDYEVTVTAADSKVPLVGPDALSVPTGEHRTIILSDPLNLSGSPELVVISDGVTSE